MPLCRVRYGRCESHLATHPAGPSIANRLSLRTTNAEHRLSECGILATVFPQCSTRCDRTNAPCVITLDQFRNINTVRLDGPPNTWSETYNMSYMQCTRRNLAKCALIIEDDMRRDPLRLKAIIKNNEDMDGSRPSRGCNRLRRDVTYGLIGFKGSRCDQEILPRNSVLCHHDGDVRARSGVRTGS